MNGRSVEGEGGDGTKHTVFCTGAKCGLSSSSISIPSSPVLRTGWRIALASSGSSFMPSNVKSSSWSGSGRGRLDGGVSSTCLSRAVGAGIVTNLLRRFVDGL